MSGVMYTHGVVNRTNTVLVCPEDIRTSQSELCSKLCLACQRAFRFVNSETNNDTIFFGSKIVVYRRFLQVHVPT